MTTMTNTNGTNGNGSTSSHDDGSVSTSRRQLPFRALKNAAGSITLECESTINGQQVPFRLPLGNINDPLEAANIALYHPVGRAVFELMGLYWDLEKQLATTTRERDDAQGEAAAARGRVQSLEGSLSELQGRQRKQAARAEK